MHYAFWLFVQDSVDESVSLCICPCILNIVNTVLLDTIHQTFSIGTFLDNDGCFKFWGRKVIVQGHGGSNVLENAFFGLVLHNVLKMTGLTFVKLLVLMHFWDKDEHFNVWGPKVSGQGHSTTNGLASGGIHSSTLACWVLIFSLSCDEFVSCDLLLQSSLSAVEAVSVCAVVWCLQLSASNDWWSYKDHWGSYIHVCCVSWWRNG